MDQSENNARKLTNELRALRQRSRRDNTIVPTEKQATRSPEIIELVPADTRHPRRVVGLVGFGLLLVVLAWALVSPPIFTSRPQVAEPVIVLPKAEIASPSVPQSSIPLPTAPVVAAPPVISAPAPAPTQKDESVNVHKPIPVRAAQGRVTADDGSDSFRVLEPPASAPSP